MTIDQLKRYDSENVQYVEFMVSSWCPDDRDRTHCASVRKDLRCQIGA